MTLRLGVVGYPVRHSISPAIHQAALDELGIAARYERWEVAPAGLAAWVGGLRAPGVLGASVTVPHKEAVMPLLDELEPLARQIGAVNTIIRVGDRLHGTNTDVAGFRRALAEAGYTPTSGDAVLLGAGGAARAVAYALLGAGVRRLAIFNRDAARAHRLAAEASGWGTGNRDQGTDDRGQGMGAWSSAPQPPTPESHHRSSNPLVEAFGLDAPELHARLARCDLLVNTTSVGMRAGERLLRPEQVPGQVLVVDIIYTPPQTTLLADAAARGARTLNGLPMLIYQAAEQFARWTGQAAPVETMFAAARRALP